MQKILLMLMTTLLLFTAACSGGVGNATTTATATVAPVTATSAATTQITTTTAASAEPAPELPEVVKPGTLIPEGFPIDDTYHADTDATQNPSDKMIYCEAMDEYYLFAEDFLMRMDPHTYEVMPLCAKEGCLHHKEPDLKKKAECYAMCSGGTVLRSIQYYDGRVYVTHSPVGGDDFVLTSISADGTDRRTELQLPNAGPYGANVRQIGSAGDTAIHRGRLYINWMRYVGENQYAAELWTWALDGSEAAPRCIFRSANTYSSSFSSGSIHAYGTRVYLLEYYNDTDTGVIKIGSSTLLDLRGNVYLFDLLTGDWTTAQTPDNYTITGHRIVNGQLQVSCQSLADIEQFFEDMKRQAAGENVEPQSPPKHLFLLELDGTNPVPSEDTAPGQTDGTYYYATEYDAFKPTEGNLSVYDPEGNLLAEYPFDKLFGLDYEYNGKAYKVQINSSSCQLLISESEKPILYMWESGNGGTSFTRHGFYLIDTSDIANGIITLQKMFGYEPDDYANDRIAEKQ